MWDMSSYDKVVDDLINKYSELYERFLKEQRCRIRLEKQLRKAKSESRNSKDHKKRSREVSKVCK